MISMNDIQGAFNRGIGEFSEAVEQIKLVAKSKEKTPEKETKKIHDGLDDLII